MTENASDHGLGQERGMGRKVCARNSSGSGFRGSVWGSGQSWAVVVDRALSCPGSVTYQLCDLRQGTSLSGPQ